MSYVIFVWNEKSKPLKRWIAWLKLPGPRARNGRSLFSIGLLFSACLALTLLTLHLYSWNVTTGRLDQTIATHIDTVYMFQLPINQTHAKKYNSSCTRGTQLNGSVEQQLNRNKKYFYDPYDDREQIFTIPFLDESFLWNLFPSCLYEPSYAYPHKVNKFKGVQEVEMIYVYPCDCTWQEKIIPYDPFTGNFCLSKKDANLIVEQFMSVLSKKYPRRFKLLKILNIESKYDYMNGQRVLLELLLQKDNEDKVYRVSHYYFSSWDSEGLCDLVDHQWNRHTHIHFLVVTKNLGEWVKHLIKNMEDIQRLTSDTNFSLIVVDFNSSDINIEHELKQSSFTNSRLIKLTKEGFYKTFAQNTGLSFVRNPNSIVFTVDLHLDLPPNILDYIRKHTIQGKSGYAPAVLRLKNNTNPMNGIRLHKWQELGRWEIWGFGLLSLFKSDWTNVGNMNLEFGKTWGGEDYDLIDRLIAKGYEVNRLLHPKLFHHYHSHRGMWTKDSDYKTDGITEEGAAS